jgi:group I intron endonuclease
MKQPVIYRIRNVVNQKFYVGSTVNTQERFRTHRKKLRAGKHHCAHLQAAWNKYGEDCFKFEILEVVIEQDLQAVEDEWLVRYVGKPECYNAGLRSGAPWRGVAKEKHPNFGRPRSEAERKAISQTLREYYAADPNNHPRVGKKHSAETRIKIRDAIQGKIASGEDHYRYGQTLSEEVRKKIGDAQRGKPKAPRVMSEEGKAKIRKDYAEGRRQATFKGKSHTTETREKMSRKVFVMPDGILFPSLTQVLLHYDLKMPTLRRALKSGKPISKGKLAGYSFSYGDFRELTDQDRALIEAGERRRLNKLVDTPSGPAYIDDTKTTNPSDSFLGADDMQTGG